MNYYDRTEMSCSKLKQLADGFENANKKKIDTPALRYGRIAHEFILESISSFIVEPEYLMKEIKYNRRVKLYQDWKKKQEKEIVSYQDVLRLREMQKSVFGKQEFFSLFNSKGTQVEVESFKDFMGIPFRSKGDIINPVIKVGADLKTTEEIKQDKIMNDMYNLKYHWQEYIYRYMFDLKDFFFIFVEKKDPYKSQIIRLNSDWMKVAEYEIKNLLDKWKLFQSNVIDDKLEDRVLSLPNYVEFKYKEIL